MRNGVLLSKSKLFLFRDGCCDILANGSDPTCGDLCMRIGGCRAALCAVMLAYICMYIHADVEKLIISSLAFLFSLTPPGYFAPF